MYLITFHSQFDANLFHKKYSKLGTVIRKPVPRELSSSCGTCCSFDKSEETTLSFDELFDKISFECVYEVVEDEMKKVSYIKLLERE